MTPDRFANHEQEAPRWPTPAEELPLFERLRVGDVKAFIALADAVHPVLSGLLRRYEDADEGRRSILERSWACALSSLEMFRWQTSFATWVGGITVEHGRAHAARRPRLRAVPASGTGPPRTGPADWADLPWGARWQGAQRATEQVLAGLSLPSLEVLHVRRIEGWTARRACDVLGLTVAGEERLLHEAERAVYDALAAVVGLEDAASPARLEAVRLMLHAPSPADPALAAPPLAVFRAWRAGQRRGWRRLLPA